MVEVREGVDVGDEVWCVILVESDRGRLQDNVNGED